MRISERPSSTHMSPTAAAATSTSAATHTRAGAVFRVLEEQESKGAMTPDPHLAMLIVSTAGVGLWMSLAGMHKSALEWKRRRRICPSCGHELRGRHCACG